MIVPADAVRVVIATSPVDFRRGHDSRKRSTEALLPLIC